MNAYSFKLKYPLEVQHIFTVINYVIVLVALLFNYVIVLVSTELWCLGSNFGHDTQ